MFNLLPLEEQHAVIREYRLRLAVTGLLFLAFLCVVASVALIPSLFLSRNKEEAVLKSNSVLKDEIALMDKDDLSGALKLAGKKALALKVEAPVFYSYELIGNITGDKISGVKIFGVSIKRSSDGSRDVILTGEAKDRETLLSFARVLEREEFFASVKVPPSNYAPVADIGFSIFAKTK